jgi:hypothetical protein
MATDRPELPVGLLWRRASIHIDTTVADRRVCRSCKTANPAVARQQLDAVRGQLQMAALTGVEPQILRERHLLDPFVVRELGRMAADGVRESTRRRYASVMCAFVAFLTKHLGRAPRVEDITHDALSSWKDQAVRTPRVRIGYDWTVVPVMGSATHQAAWVGKGCVSSPAIDYWGLRLLFGGRFTDSTTCDAVFEAGCPARPDQEILSTRQTRCHSRQTIHAPISYPNCRLALSLKNPDQKP